MSETLALEDAKALIGLCRAGKLYEIESWIASGKSIHMPPTMKQTPLRVAIEIGFHSLIELLARTEDSVAIKNAALAYAVELRRLELVQLLVSYGAEIQSVSLVDVLLTWEPKMIRFFLDSGADAITGAPFAIGFKEKVRTSLRLFVEYRRAHPELAASLQEQADRALRHFCDEGNMKWVSLLLWAGANPRTRGPDLDDRWADDPECHTTALMEACSRGNVEVLKKLKPDSNVDDLSELLSSAAYSTSKEMIKYLLALGAKPNDKPNGGSSALDHCLHHLNFPSFEALRSNRLATKYEVSATLECIRELVEHGARWKPEERHHMNWIRQGLYKCEPAVTVDLVKLLAGKKACSEETLEQLLDPPRMRSHLSTIGLNMFTGTRTKHRKSGESAGGTRSVHNRPQERG